MFVKDFNNFCKQKQSIFFSKKKVLQTYLLISMAFCLACCCFYVFFLKDTYESCANCMFNAKKKMIFTERFDLLE